MGGLISIIANNIPSLRGQKMDIHCWQKHLRLRIRVLTSSKLNKSLFFLYLSSSSQSVDLIADFSGQQLFVDFSRCTAGNPWPRTFGSSLSGNWCESRAALCLGPSFYKEKERKET